MRVRHGWPMRCVTYDKYDTRGGSASRRWVRAVKLGRLPELPIRPLWPGVAVDVLLFGAALAGVHELVAWPWRAWKRHFARVNRLCENCKYERSGVAADAPCPECGAVPPPVK